MKSATITFTIILALALLAGCNHLTGPGASTPLEAEFMPTAVALTLGASGINVETPTSLSLTDAPRASTTPTELIPSSTATATLEPTLTDTPTPLPATATLTTTLLTTTPSIDASITPFPEIPEATVQIYRLGELSKVASPILVSARLTSRTGKVARVDLWGEDGRLLGREVKVFYTLPWHVATLSLKLDFEIRAAAEIGRLVVGVEDIYGRLMDLNSVNLVLLSAGETELNPATALWQAIVIQEPQPNALIVGGIVYVSGLARPNDPSQPLHIELIAEDGQIVGQRLAKVSIPIPGGHGTFSADVPYSVSELTPVRLVVYETGGVVSAMTHLSSVEILLSP